jgi:hypothetical protein
MEYKGRLASYGLLSLSIIGIMYFTDIMPDMGLEVVFPGLSMYYLLTYTMSYPEANKLRKYLVCFLLSFGDIIVTSAIF